MAFTAKAAQTATTNWLTTASPRSPKVAVAPMALARQPPLSRPVMAAAAVAAQALLAAAADQRQPETALAETATEVRMEMVSAMPMVSVEFQAAGWEMAASETQALAA